MACAFQKLALSAQVLYMGQSLYRTQRQCEILRFAQNDSDTRHYTFPNCLRASYNTIAAALARLRLRTCVLNMGIV